MHEVEEGARDEPWTAVDGTRDVYELYTSIEKEHVTCTQRKMSKIYWHVAQAAQTGLFSPRLSRAVQCL